MMVSTTQAGGRVFIGTGEGRKRFNVLSAEIELLAGKEQTGGASEAVESVFPAGRGVPLHYHEGSDETLYVLDGELTILTADEAIAAPARSFVNLLRGVVHGFENRSQGPVRALIMWSPPLGPGAETVFTTLATIPPGPPDMSKLVPLMQSMDMNLALPKEG